MCSPTRCRRCGKTTWSGCGNHVDQVMGDVPSSQRCRCSSDGPPEAGARKPGGLLGRILGR